MVTLNVKRTFHSTLHLKFTLKFVFYMIYPFFFFTTISSLFAYDYLAQDPEFVNKLLSDIRVGELNSQPSGEGGGISKKKLNWLRIILS